MDLERMGTLCLLHHNQAYISDTYPYYLHSRSLIHLARNEFKSYLCLGTFTAYVEGMYGQEKSRYKI